MEDSTESLLKDNRLNIRCDLHSRQLLEKAANYTLQSISEFVLTHAVAAAREVVSTHEATSLQADYFQAFLEALDPKPVPNPALKRAVKRHNQKVS